MPQMRWAESMTLDEFKDNQRKFAAYQAKAMANPTKAEAMVNDALSELGIRYTFQKGFLRDKTIRLVDFFFGRPLYVCLEVDGGYHNKPDQMRYDEYREGRIKMQRVRELRFVRVTNEWVFDQENLKQSLAELLGLAS